MSISVFQRSDITETTNQSRALEKMAVRARRSHAKPHRLMYAFTPVSSQFCDRLRLVLDAHLFEAV